MFVLAGLKWGFGVEFYVRFFLAHVEFVYCSCVRSECNAAALNITAPCIPPPGSSHGARSQNPPFPGFRRQLLAVVRGSCVCIPSRATHRGGGGGGAAAYQVGPGTARVIPGPGTKTGLINPGGGGRVALTRMASDAQTD
jgi:hypothetical protein